MASVSLASVRVRAVGIPLLGMLVLLLYALLLHAPLSSARENLPLPITSADSSPLVPKVARYCQRILDQLGQEDPRGLPLELWPDGRESAEAWDLNQDGYLSARELAETIQKYARHRSLRVLAIPPPASAGASNGRLPDAPPQGPAIGDSAELPSEQVKPSEVGSSAKGDSPPITPPSRSSRSRQEAVFQVAPSRLSAGAPSWFLDLDKNGDGQLTLSEYAPEPTGQSIAEFRRLDWNNDGVITLEEARRGPQPEP
jgi:hypothetical protein